MKTDITTIINDCGLEELTDIELKDIDGGRPSKDTSLAYDIFWCIATVLIAAGEGASGIKG